MRFSDRLSRIKRRNQQKGTNFFTGVSDNMRSSVDKVKNTPKNVKQKIKIPFQRTGKEFSNMKNSVKNASGIRDKTSALINGIIKTAKTVKKSSLIISIVFGIISFIFSGTMFFLSVGDSFASTVHYYCDIGADSAIKSSELYKQYCKNVSSSGGNESIAKAAVTLATTDEETGGPFVLRPQGLYEQPQKFHCRTLLRRQLLFYQQQ